MIIDFWHPDMSEVRPLLSLLLRVCCSAVFFSLYLLAFRIAPKNSLVIRRSESRLWGPICPGCARMPPWPPPTSPLARHALNCNLRLFVSRFLDYNLTASPLQIQCAQTRQGHGNQRQVRQRICRRAAAPAIFVPASCIRVYHVTHFQFLMSLEQIRAHRRRGDT